MDVSLLLTKQLTGDLNNRIALNLPAAFSLRQATQDISKIRFEKFKININECYSFKIGWKKLVTGLQETSLFALQVQEKRWI